MRSGLPIDTALPPLTAALAAQRNAVLVAPPGAGKSTVVPLALLGEAWAKDKRIVMLEPRRLAARAVATRMATTLRESPGDTVGYRMRLETRVGPNTRLEVVTEGVFTRMLQADPALTGIAAVLFDEYPRAQPARGYRSRARARRAATRGARAAAARDVGHARRRRASRRCSAAHP